MSPISWSLMAVVAMFFEDGALRMPSTIQIFQRVTARMMMTLLDTSSPPTWPSRNNAKHIEAIPEAIHGHPWPPDPIEWCRTSPATARPQVISGYLCCHCAVRCASSQFYPALLHRTSLLAKELLPAHPWNSRLAAQVCVFTQTQTYPNIPKHRCFMMFLLWHWIIV